MAFAEVALTLFLGIGIVVLAIAVTAAISYLTQPNTVGREISEEELMQIFVQMGYVEDKDGYTIMRMEPEEKDEDRSA